MADDIKRLNYFNGQFLREKDFSDEQSYHLQHQRDHARLLHNPGIASGLEVPDPAAGSHGVTVQAGVAYDGQGRRIVLADNKVLDLSGVADDQAVYITITYNETPTDPTSETGISGNTRQTEAPLVAFSTAAPGNPNQTLVLAKVARSSTVVSSIDRSGRLQAGAKGGDLSANSLTLTSDTVAPSGWAKIRLTGTSQTQLDASLLVNGTLSGALAPGLVGTKELADGSVTTQKLVDGSVTTAKIANQAVNTGQIADGAVTTAKIANLAVTTGQIGNLAVNTGQIANLAVNTGQIANGAVTTAKIANLAVTTGQIGNLAVTTGQIADGAVTTAKIANLAVTTGQIGNLAVTTGQIADGAVTGAKIANLAITTGHIVDGSVTAAKIADLNVGTAELVNLAVTNAKLADGSVTATKIANYAVGTAQLGDGNVTAAKMAASSVGTTQLADGSIPFGKFKVWQAWNSSATLGAGASTKYGLGVTDTGGIIFVDVMPTSASGSVSWNSEVWSGSVPSNSWTHYVKFTNNSTTASVSFAFKIYQLMLS